MENSDNSTTTLPQSDAAIDRFFKEAFFANASDLHLAVNRPPLVRISGELIELAQYQPFTAEQLEEMIMAMLQEKQREILMARRELDFAYALPNTARFRVNVHWERDHIGLVARVISDRVPTMEELSMPPIVYDLVRLRNGLVLLTGPTGVGKTTSLAAMIDYINTTRAEHIVTLEDPIEFLFQAKRSLIRQRELHKDFLSFADALKHVVRQDPNVIMVGEMRDLETVAAALTVAETGHLVLATLHTVSAAETIERIVDIFPPHQQKQIISQIALVLRGVISQQLLPKQNGGRIAAREIMINTPAIANLIRENKIEQIASTMQTGAEAGMRTMDQAVRMLYESGDIILETAQSYMLHPESLERTG